MVMKTAAKIVFGLVLTSFAGGVAQADVISLTSASVGSSFSLDYDGFTGDGTIAGLTGSTTFTLTGISDGSYSFDYSVANTSSSPITGSRISGFGFNTNPDFTSASSTGVFDTVGTGNAPNIGTVDVCFKGGGGTGNCAGGGGDGVSLGDTATGTLTLAFTAALGQLSLSDFFVRYQSIAGAGGTTSAVGTGTLSSSGGTPVPEPATLALFAMGVAGVVIGRRRSRHRFSAHRA
jgi:hypothetical protein